MPSPSGTRLTDGFPTRLTLSGATTAPMWETEVTPPGMDGGGPNDTTTMRATAYRTRQPKKLKSLTAFQLVCQYDPVAYSVILAQINVNQSMSITLPNGGVETFYGWVDKFTPNRIVEGQPPTANVTVEPSNQDNTGAEVAPTYTPPP